MEPHINTCIRVNGGFPHFYLQNWPHEIELSGDVQLNQQWINITPEASQVIPSRSKQATSGGRILPGCSTRSVSCYKCGTCAKVCLSQTGLQNHIASVHGAVKPFVCLRCYRSYTTRAKLRRHERESHRGIYPHICQLCFKGFSNISRLKGHLVSHGGAPQFSCQSCSKHYRYKQDYIFHMEKHHPGYNPQTE